MESIGPTAAFLGGLLTAFTPCVYPVIPLTLAAFGGRAGSLGRRAALAALFAGSMAALYGSLGALAALGGAMFGEVASHPAMKLGAGVILIVLGLGLLGLYVLQLPARVRTALDRLAANKGPWVRAAILGAVSGLLSASCTGPVLGALLVSAGVGGGAAQGVSLLFLYALGLSLPFFALALVLQRPPRPGRWMEVTKLVLGAAVVASGLGLALSVAPALAAALTPAGTAGVAAAGGLLAAALGLAIFAKKPMARHVAASVLAVAALVPMLLPLLGPTAAGAPGAAAASRSILTPLPWRVVHTRAELESALAHARLARKPALVELYAGWCSDCRKLDERVFAREDVRSSLARFELVRIDASEITDELRGMGRRYGLKGFPGLAYHGSDGTLDPTLTQRGVRSPEEVLDHLGRVH